MMRVGMKNQDVYDLMDRFEKSGIARMKFESGDTSLELEKTIAVSGVPAVEGRGRSGSAGGFWRGSRFCP